MFRFFWKLIGNRKTTPPKTTTKKPSKKMRSPQHNSGLCWNRPWPQNCSPNICVCKSNQIKIKKCYLKSVHFITLLEIQTYPISRRKKKIPKFNIMSFCEYFIKILIKHSSKYKILRWKTVEEVSRTDERVDMGKLISRSTFRRGAL